MVGANGVESGGAMADRIYADDTEVVPPGRDRICPVRGGVEWRLMCEGGFIEIRWDGALDLRLAGCGRHGGSAVAEALARQAILTLRN